eukprot:PLAT11319.1.p1 GENE.PLAT11319.1~~PLAT11319.1.p1  ORF type:complete len:441 (-),score=182.27 PLAT11319.1:71-1228(-)
MGVDALLTYHYLVAETFTVLPSSKMTPEAFFELSERQQADIVWQTLFIDRLPLSEAARGVVTALCALGYADEVAARDLEAIRAGIAAQIEEKGRAAYVDAVLASAGVRYVVMTNVPFSAEEASHWPADGKRDDLPAGFRTALRVDPVLKWDEAAIAAAVAAEDELPAWPEGGEEVLEEQKAVTRQLLLLWAERLQPEYVMASMADDPGWPLEAIVLPLCAELRLPFALKIGAARGLNPRLRDGGDGVVTVDLSFLASLLSRWREQKFLVTVLSRVNQHEACVLANKFGNLHLYGCWWYLNNPSIIEEMTAQRLELLGSAFTAQHSDARVLEQLLYKWRHSRAVIARVAAQQFKLLVQAGWRLARSEVRRDVARLLGGAYEEFMRK